MFSRFYYERISQAENADSYQSPLCALEHLLGLVNAVLGSGDGHHGDVRTLRWNINPCLSLFSHLTMYHHQNHHHRQSRHCQNHYHNCNLYDGPAAATQLYKLCHCCFAIVKVLLKKVTTTTKLVNTGHTT